VGRGVVEMPFPPVTRSPREKTAVHAVHRTRADSAEKELTRYMFRPNPSCTAKDLIIYVW
jgi:hypothetical protein